MDFWDDYGNIIYTHDINYALRHKKILNDKNNKFDIRGKVKDDNVINVSEYILGTRTLLFWNEANEVYLSNSLVDIYLLLMFVWDYFLQFKKIIKYS